MRQDSRVNEFQQQPVKDLILFVTELAGIMPCVLVQVAELVYHALPWAIEWGCESCEQVGS